MAKLLLCLKNEEDEDMQKSTLIEAQESAGFFEPGERCVLGGLFNQTFFFSTIGASQPGEPTGAVS